VESVGQYGHLNRLKIFVIRNNEDY